MASKIFLLDVNVLIALIDPAHVQHDIAHLWFVEHGRKAWATCPLTENGVVRIVGHPRYPNSPGAPGGIAQIMRRFCKQPGHVFWPDNISLLDQSRFHAEQLLVSNQITDSYLLALACSHDGQLATFDQRLTANAVVRGKQALNIIGNG